METHVIVIAVTTAVVGVPLATVFAVILWRKELAIRRMTRERDAAVAQTTYWAGTVAKQVRHIDQQTEVNGVRLKKLLDRSPDISQVDTQPIGHLRVIGGRRGA